MHSRRTFLIGGATATASGIAITLSATPALGQQTDWEAIRSLFTVPVDHAVLQNASATIPFTAAIDAATQAYRASHDPRVSFATLLEQIEQMRSLVAASIGADVSSIAIMRNTTEAMRTVQFGLDFGPGDEVLAASVDYDLAVWRQSLVRQGVKLCVFDLPLPAPTADEIVALYEAQMTPGTRYMLISEVVSSSGQALPVAAICAAARERGILTMVDGAQGYALSGADVQTMGCDFYCASLHKWLGGARGMGFLYIRPGLVEKVWPLLGNYADVGQSGRVIAADDVHKFEQVGTMPTALWAAQTAVFPFLDDIPPAVRRARLQALRDRLMDGLADVPGIRFLHGRGEATMGMAALAVDGGDHSALVRALRAEKILVKALDEGNVRCIRISPSIYTREAEIDRFIEALTRLIRQRQ